MPQADYRSNHDGVLRNKRVSVPLSREQYLKFRRIAARRDLHLSRLLLAMIEDSDEKKLA